MSRLTWHRAFASAGLAGACLLQAGTGAAEVEVAPDLRAEVVVVGIPRPVQLALDGAGHLVVLSQGWRGDAAGEVYHFDLAALPLDASHAPRVVIPFSDEPRKAALGSVALDPRSQDLFMGEENGNRIYRLGAGGRLTVFGVGLNNLLGGSSLTFDRLGRLVVVDYTSPEEQQRSESPPPASFEALAGDAYQGPVVIRLDPHEDVRLPRRFDLITPVLPSGSVRPDRVEPLYRFISLATTPSGAIVLLDSVGHLFTLNDDRVLRLLVRLPAGHYHRTNMAVGPDGSVFVSSGFQIRQIFRVSPEGVVEVVAQDLGDPEGIAVDGDGTLYVAENALHRVIRIRSRVRLPRASQR